MVKRETANVKPQAGAIAHCLLPIAFYLTSYLPNSLYLLQASIK